MLIARSSLECHLYMELHPCACGETAAPQKHRLLSGESGLIARYDGACPRCGSLRRFDFVLADEIVPLETFGGAMPSTILDAGQFLAYADAAPLLLPPPDAT